MAVHFAAGAGNYAQRTTGLLSPSVPSTVMCWVNFGAIPVAPGYTLAFALLDDPAVYAEYMTMDAVSPAVLELAGPGHSVNQGAPSAGVWFHLGWTQSGTTVQRFYVNGSLINSFVLDRGLFTVGFDMIGNDTFADGNISIAYMRQWGATLDVDEILIEMQATAAVRTAALWLDCPFTTNLNDVSGNGRNYTLVGADSFVASPTFPSNSLPSTATVLSGLPTSATTDFGDGFYAWYTYQSVPADLEAGFLARSNLTDTLTVTSKYGTPSSLTTFGLPAVNQPFILPTAGGDSWYFKVSSGVTTPTDDVVVDAQLPPDETIPVGAIGVNDDGNYDANGTTPPATFLNGQTGATLGFALASPGEAGTVFPPTGQVCLYNILTETVNIFPAELGTPTVTVPDASFFGSGLTNVISSDQTTQFYVGGFEVATTAHVKTLSLTGTVGATNYAIPITSGHLACMAPTQDNTILYYGDSGTATAIRRWNLTLNSALSNLAAGVANHVYTDDLLVLADGTILVGYVKSTATTDYFVRHYSAAGAILHTYNTFGATNRLNRMAHAIDDPTSFWVWLYLDDDPATDFGGSVSRFVNVNIADGSSLASLDAVNWEGGHNTAEPSADPLRFGHSFSCPFWINRVGVTPTPSVSTTEYIIRRERVFPVIGQEQKNLFIHKLQLYFEAGTGLSTGQGSDPICELDWSKDGGHTWSNLHLLHTGRMGQYTVRAIQRRMGVAREWTIRVAVSDPVQWSLIDGWFDPTLGAS